MIFDYNAEEVYTKQLDIVDIGNTCIRATNEELVDFYFITKTIMGKTSIVKFGPIMPDVNILLDNFSLIYKKITYKEGSICKEINLFINDTKKKITEVKEITEYEAFQELPNIAEAFNNL